MEVARKSFTATGEEDRRWQGLVLASAVAGMVQHAAGEFVSAGENIGAGAAARVGAAVAWFARGCSRRRRRGRGARAGGWAARVHGLPARLQRAQH